MVCLMDKQHILTEIRRTAEANGGKPLGQNRFFTETGIKIADWRDKFWLRWGDALVEAGFAPNQWSAGYEDEELILKLVGFIRELGHYPIKEEFVMKSRIDPSFPSYGPFSRRGSKAQILEKVLDFCRRTDGFNDVVAICEPLIKPTSEDNRPSSDTPSKDGYVYLIQSGRRYKIGATNDLANRSRAIAVQMPDPTDTVHVIRTDDPFGIEAYWHKRFVDKRTNGEWFELSRDDVAAFRRRKTM